MPWLNDDLILYHGCTEESVQPQNSSGIALGTTSHGINPSVGAPDTDFGLGFYTTTWLDQAASWANNRHQQRAAAKPGNRHRALVLKFSVKRNDLASLQSLVFTNERIDYWPFVTYCRTGGAPHGRMGCLNARYDIVYGPVSLWTQRLVIKDADQVSFHTPAAVSVIPTVTIAATGSPLFP